MTYYFEVIMHKWHHNRGDFIFAKHLGDNHQFDIPEDSIFGDTPIYHYKEMYPIKGENDIERYDIFVFRATSLTFLKRDHFTEGQKVTLITPDSIT